MQRDRITITLRHDLIRALDAEVDGVKIRNRSHAIETFLSHKLNPPVRKAIILAADQGIKFRPFTYEMPKAMLPIHGRPLLEHIIVRLREFDVNQIYISVGYLSEKIKSYFGDGTKFGVQITYIEQRALDLGTGGALKNFQSKISPNEAFFLIYGDVLADVNYVNMVEFYHAHKGVLGVIGLTTVSQPELWGVVKLAGDNIKEFTEKPLSSAAKSHLISAGIYLLNQDIFSFIPKRPKFSLERDVFPRVLKKAKLSGYVLSGDWYDISTPQIYEQVLREWK